MAKALDVLRIIEQQAKTLKQPLIIKTKAKSNPYQTLILCLLSLRTKDIITEGVGKKLFKHASTPKDMVKLKPSELEKIIHPVGFYRNKARAILKITETIIQKHQGRVPKASDELLRLSGVGRKTANLVLGMCYNIPAICVDTHVHRISNRLGWVKTKTPLDTERGLAKAFKRQYWIKLNPILVSFGQNICTPSSPHCSRCLANEACPKIGVKKQR